MKKSFKLKIPGRNDERVMEALKHDIRQYIKREKRKPTPQGVDFWEFDCRFGKNVESAEVIKFSEIISRINAAAAANDDEFYIEILAKAGHKSVKDESEAQEALADETKTEE